MLKGKNILLGISGGIAAYKCGELIRLLVKAGAEVKVVSTENALRFITPLTLQTLSHNKVYSEMFDTCGQLSLEHISLADWADCMIVAPATANIIGKFASGIADDALSTTFLALDRPVFLAPAMNTNMYMHAVVQRNIAILKEIGVRFIEPADGELACGVMGKGRMEEPADIVECVDKYL
jgi:phosphopantothenoylcysteine decarboxylase/phosphopantothenate--cysteine ligase